MDMTISAGGQTIKTTTEDVQRAADELTTHRFAKDQLKRSEERRVGKECRL